MFDRKTRMQLIDAVKIGIELIKVIERVHKLGICHNDIKPDNILLDSR